MCKKSSADPQLVFTAHEYRAKLYRKIWHYLQGRSCRRELFKLFVNTLYINPKDSHVQLPQSYLITLPQLKSIAKVRDLAIVRERERYNAISANLKVADERLADTYQKEQKRLQALEKDIAKAEKRMEKELDAEMRVALPARISEYKAAHANLSRYLHDVELERDKLAALAKQNNSTWDAQVREIRGIYDQLCQVLLRAASKKIRHRFGFNNFEYIEPPIEIEGVSLENRQSHRKKVSGSKAKESGVKK